MNLTVLEEIQRKNSKQHKTQVEIKNIYAACVNNMLREYEQRNLQ